MSDSTPPADDGPRWQGACAHGRGWPVRRPPHRHRPSRRPPHRHRGRRLFWRIYLHGVLLLLIVGGAFALAARSVGLGQPWREGVERMGRYVAVRLEPQLDDPAVLQRELEEIRTLVAGDVALYGADHQLRASVGPEVPAAVEQVPTDVTVQGRAKPMRLLVPVRSGPEGAYLVARVHVHADHSQLLVVLAAVLLAMALASLPLARAIARPLERLTKAAKRLGDGDLSARSGIRRRDEVGDLALAFDDMAERINGLLQQDKELLANVSHELKTPMARIRVALELCGEDASAPEARSEDRPDEPQSDDPQLRRVREHLQGIGGDLAELEKLVEDVMMTARLGVAAQAGGASSLPMHRGRELLVDVLGEAAERFARHHPEHELDRHTAVDCEIDADPALLRRLFDNLLDNAAKYAEPASGPIEIEAEATDDGVQVEVRDRGPGVDEEDLPRLFEPFFRADRSRTRGTGGSGLGLALCARIVEAHGGHIEARQRDGGGLVVAVSLPTLEPGAGQGSTSA